jgi:hypothetical protein
MLSAILYSLATVAVAGAIPVDHVARQAAASVHITNQCTFSVNYWVNGKGVQVLPAGGKWSEAFVPNEPRTITLMTSPRINSADPKVLMGYTYKPDQSTVYYDLYSPAGATSPFKGFKVVQKSMESSCRVNQWADGVQVPGDHITGCRSDRDVDLLLCAK